ncbi:MAG: guanylate cyclase [Eggerthellaceae bacterium]|nr:guanylate cyclase [Eggerthellaceae bacterium]
MVARLTRLLPIFFGIAVAALALYVFISIRYTPIKAKEVLIKLFTILFGLATLFFLLATIYAALDSGRMEAVELMASFLLPFAAGLGVTLVCRAVFLHNHPAYKLKPVRAKTIKDPLWKRFLNWVLLQH